MSTDSTGKTGRIRTWEVLFSTFWIRGSAEGDWARIRLLQNGYLLRLISCEGKKNPGIKPGLSLIQDLMQKLQCVKLLFGECSV